VSKELAEYKDRLKHEIRSGEDTMELLKKERIEHAKTNEKLAVERDLHDADNQKWNDYTDDLNTKIDNLEMQHNEVTTIFKFFCEKI
jgi:archaellum biogenesis protein FlaJ (TadC family)